jgi:DNA-binding CsgD family transcriptional regulator
VNDPIAIVEAAYALTGDETEWLERLVQVALPSLERGHGVLAFTYDATDALDIRVRRITASASFDPGLFTTASQLGLPKPADELIAPMFRRTFVDTLRRVPMALRRAGMPDVPLRQFERALVTYFHERNLVDEFWVNAQDPTYLGCCFIAPTSSRSRWQPSEARQWRRIAAHVTTAFRIRRHFASIASGGAVAKPPEATFASDARLVHAEDSVKDSSTRAALRQAVLAMDRARGPLRRCDPEQAVAIWRALVAGRWSLLEHFDSDGRRFIVAHRIDATVPDERGLTLPERQVVAYVALGRSNKAIAYDLGLSLSAVAHHLARARAKLRLPSQAALRVSSLGPR